MIIAGCLCFAYYFALVASAKRWNTTFAGFWIMLGVGFLMLGKIWPYAPGWMQMVIIVCAAASAVFFAVIEGKIISAMTKSEPEGLGWLIVLGAQVRGTKITDSLRRRLDRAVSYCEKNPDVNIIVSGGKGDGENITEALAMARYLEENGIAKERIFREERSTSTYENLINSREILPDSMRTPIGIVTNNFHIYRALKLAGDIGYEKVYGIPAGTKPIVLPNYMMREFFAEIKRMIFRR